MSKTFLIFRHEFTHLIKRRAFIVMTLIVPILAVIGIGVIGLTSHIQSAAGTAITKIGYVGQAGGFDGYLSQSTAQLTRYETSLDATQALLKGDVSEYFVIPQDYVSTGKVALYTLQKELNVPSQTLTAMNQFLVDNLISGKIPATALDRVNDPLNKLQTITLTKTGEVSTDQGGGANFIIPAIFSILLALSMVFSSSYMLQGLGEEKENRLIEVLLSSVSARQLLAGKVLGLGAGGLLQVAVWVGSMVLIFSLPLASGLTGVLQLPPGFLVLSLVYFILGYFLFAVLAAGVGAVSSSLKEAQQLSSMYTLFAIVPLWLMSVLIINPGSPIWTVLTIFPLTAPTTVMERVGLTSIPPLELAISIAVLAASLIGVMLLTAKIFKVYLLMYGKRPNIKEILKNLK